MLKRTETAVLDLSVLRESIGDRPELIADVMASFLLAIDTELDALLRAADQSDATMTTRAAHRIKGAARAVGATRLAELCQSIEAAAHVSSWDSVHRCLQRFPVAVEEVADAIRGP